MSISRLKSYFSTSQRLNRPATRPRSQGPPAGVLQPPEGPSQDSPPDPAPLGIQRLVTNHQGLNTTDSTCTSGPAAVGPRCDIMYLDARYNKKGDYEIKPSTYLYTGERGDSALAEYALVSTRFFDQEGKQKGGQLEVASPHILRALKSVAPYYPGAPVITETKVVYEQPFHVLLHCFEDLQEYRNKSEDDTTRLYVGLLIRVIRIEMGRELDELAAILPAKKITFPLAWAIFRPGTMVFTKLNGAPEQYRLYGTNYDKDQAGNYFNVTGEQIDYDGKEFRTKRCSLRIQEYLGAADISSLQVYPLKFHPEKEATVQSLVERGHKWHQIQRAAPKTLTCVGICKCVGKEDKMRKFRISGRIVADNTMFGLINPEVDPTVDGSMGNLARLRAQDHSDKDNDRDSDSCVGINNEGGMGERILTQVGADREFTEEEAALCTAFVRGYSFNKRLWGYFDVSLTKEVEWSTNAFEQLILHQQPKEAIRALVKSYIDTPVESIIPDLIQGKGLGLLFLLHGPPGVGKTLTAETIAEHLRRPLYVVSGGELGTYSYEVDANLSTIMEIATAWKAVVLIDEADVFLQKRNIDNLQRNSLVSIFLRQLEYYEGLMFLTTNRANCIDEAFESRIDVTLNYPDLTEAMRRQLWESSLKSLDPDSLDINFETALPLLQKEKMNGREIRKVIKAANLMASYFDEKLSLDRLNVLMGFRMANSLPRTNEESDSKLSNSVGLV